MINKIGIDAGGTFIKIAYEENSRLHQKSFLSKNLKETSNWINMLFLNSEKIIAGGKAELLQNHLMNVSDIVSEFDASCSGVKYLLQKEFHKNLKKYIIVSIGTGTSIFLVENNQHSRIIGSGIGGGTFLGLGSLITGTNDYAGLVEMAKTGNRTSIDLMVADIYYSSKPPISGDLTAANFAKGNQILETKQEDVIDSLVNMIAETLCLLVSQAAINKQIQDIVCIGGALTGNAPLKTALTKNFQLLGLDSYFPISGQFAGAIGALYHNVGYS
jgi:type II pantothenate kinase